MLLVWHTVREIIVDPHHGFVKINSKSRLGNVDDVFVFAKQCQQIYYTYTPSFRKDCSRVDWLSIVKTKPIGRVKVVQDGNNELTMGGDVFQLGELVDLYRVAMFNDLEENLNFHIVDNIFVDVNAKELNDVLSSSRHTQVNKDDDSNEINIKDCDKNENGSIDEEEDNSD